MTPRQQQLHRNISFKGTLAKIDKSLPAATIKFNSLVLKTK